MNNTTTTLIPRVRTRAWHGQMPIDVPTFDQMNLVDALKASYPSDACVVMYGVNGQGPAGKLPRLGKTSLSYYQMRGGEDAPTLNQVLIDIDYENHTTPPADWHLGILGKLPDIPHGWYRTPNGLRIILIPNRPVSLGEAESYLQWIKDTYMDPYNIPYDPATWQWFRLFKCPHALGRVLPMDLDNLAPLANHPDRLSTIIPSSLGTIIEHPAIPTALPTITKAGLASRIKDKRLVTDIYEGTVCAPVGERHAVLVRTAWALAKAFKTNDPARIFSAIRKSSINMQKPDDEVWRICEWVTAAYQGAEEEVLKASKNALQRLAEFHNVDTHEAIRYVILDTGAQFYIWDEDREDYTGPFKNTRTLIATMQTQCPSILSGIGYRTKDDLINQAALPLSAVGHQYMLAHSKFDPTTRELILPAAGVDRELNAEFHQDVHRWLCALGGASKDHLLDWLAAVPRLDKPACALYLDGPKNVGKGLLTVGLARIFNRDKAFTNYKVLLTDFQAELIRSPLIVADEKVPQDSFRKNDSSTFREVITNPTRRIRGLYETPQTLHGYIRLLISANNDDALGIREDLTAEDVEAIRERIGYIKCDDAATRLFEKMCKEHDTDMVSDITQPWADYKIAEHVLWLAKTRDINQSAGRRLLVSGWKSTLTDMMMTKQGSADIIATAIAQAIYNNQQNNAIRWGNGSIYVHSNNLAQAWRFLVNDIDRPPSAKSRLKALRALSNDTTSKLESPIANGKKRKLMYWCIPADTIAQYAQSCGICDYSDIVLVCNNTDVATGIDPSTSNIDGGSDPAVAGFLS